MKRLIICGKANLNITATQLKTRGTELWMCGTDPRDGADKYFEFHGLKVPHDNVITELPEEVYSQGIPVNNTIAAMLVYAWLQGYKNVSVIGAPMNAKTEYLNQRPALAYVIGWLNAKGMNIEWEVIPLPVNYGFKSKKETEDGEIN